MRLRCKEGDLAIITGEESGRETYICCVVKVYGPLRESTGYNALWLIEPLHHQLWKFLEVDGSALCQTTNLEDRILHPDAWMIPVSPATERLQNCCDQELECVEAVLEYGCNQKLRTVFYQSKNF
jgi:hypothetical protein